MKEKEVMEVLEATLSATLEMDGEGQWDSLDQVTLLQALDTKTGGAIDALPESAQQELGIAVTPRKMIDALKKYEVI